MINNNTTNDLSQVLQSISVNFQIKKSLEYIAQRRSELQGDGPSRIDLIQGRKSVEKSKKPDDEKWEWKLQRARERLERKKDCGKRGCIGVDGNNRKVVYHPYSCGCVSCRYCAVKESRKYMRKYYEFLEEWVEKKKRISFVTLTIMSMQDLKEQVDLISRSLRRLYDFKLFGRRNWRKVEDLFYRELEDYKRGLKEGEQYKAERQLEFFEMFKERWRDEISRGSDVRMGQLFDAVWKLEVTYDAGEGWHAHWHGIVLEYIPKLLLTVVWKLVTQGQGQICDIRQVKGKKAIVELMKYTTKFWDLEGVEEEKIVELEAVLYGRHRVRHWGFGWLEDSKEEDSDEDYKQLWWIEASLVNRPNLSGLWRDVREMKRRGIKEKVWDVLRIYPFDDSRNIKCEVYLNDRGELFVKDERVFRLMQEIARRGDYLEDFPGWWKEQENGSGWVEQVEIEQDIDENSLPF